MLTMCTIGAETIMPRDLLAKKHKSFAILLYMHVPTPSP